MAITSNQKLMIENIAKRYADVLSTKIKLHSLYVFGSYVTGENDEDSDIDIAVIADDFTGNPIEDMFKLLDLRHSVDVRIEPHPFLSAAFTPQNSFAREILNTGLKIL